VPDLGLLLNPTYYRDFNLKSIKTLVKDIYALFDPSVHVEPKQEHLDQFGENMKRLVKEKLAEVSALPALRMSNLGSKCDRQLWLKINEPGKGEAMPPYAFLKFIYGSLIEELLLLLAKVSGHEVTDEQKTVNIGGVEGHIDAKIDGVLIDVKSASTYSFKKFEEGLKPEQDSFGYLTQLGSYNYAETGSKMPAGFLAMDKQNGFLHLDLHTDGINNTDYEALVKQKQAMLAGPMPERGFDDVPDGYKKKVDGAYKLFPNGNRKLGLECSYCDRKNRCWPGLKTYAYSHGPVFFTKVVKEPKVEEISS
jgi:hypothetical protein